MAHFNIDEIHQLEHLYKINLINSCAGYKSANLIATKSTENNTNVAIFSSVIHLGSTPPLLGFILRPTSVPRNTYENIIKTGFYTINHIHKNILKDAHHTSAKYKSTISEFDVTNLETDYKKNFFAPFVKDCPIQIGMKYIEEYDIKLNNTKLVIGEIQELHIKDELIQKDGFINLSEGNIATINGLNGYAIPKLKERFEYQRPIK
ncbi:flavin reductase (DIM6/NTAB) family NADH-FMN oxidoreductase RutF [Lutibacter oceani]|uniref:Flavin reductase (DIM6/NTAB) family NADH-FMN oxidoreductase RutF n=1 Tax=Lutibacter oceani TaxID=1853311 RepID=A0A3D9RJG3_9FLAO|nr:flavin reductase [Lutibacter oceani]REE79867.1 flavin reductase (DIM6/NTAB) family NADH-FMN oxidoreductase RutF [Lutibacter oceani]